MLSDQSCDCREGIHIPDTAEFPVTLKNPTVCRIQSKCCASLDFLLKLGHKRL